MPTRFGNVVRAFEVYAERCTASMPIPGWPRLVAVVPAFDFYLPDLAARAGLDLPATRAEQ